MRVPELLMAKTDWLWAMRHVLACGTPEMIVSTERMEKGLVLTLMMVRNHRGKQLLETRRV